MENYESLFQNIDESFVRAGPEARGRIREGIESREDSCWGLELEVEMKSPLKGIYKLEFIESPFSGKDHLHLDLDGIRLRVLP